MLLSDFRLPTRTTMIPLSESSDILDGMEIVICHPTITEMTLFKVGIDKFDSIPVDRTLAGYATVFHF